MGIVAGVSALVGTGLAVKGAMDSRKAAATQAAQTAAASEAMYGAQQDITAAQQKQEGLRRQQMELDARRKSLEIVRNQQRARSLALAATTAFGAGNSSALFGTYGQYQGSTATQTAALGQNLLLGRRMFDYQAEESAAKLQYAKYAGQYNQAYATGQSSIQQASALTSLGGTLISNSSTLGSLAQEAGSFGNRFAGYVNYGTNPGTGIGGGVNPYYS